MSNVQVLEQQQADVGMRQQLTIGNNGGSMTIQPQNMGEVVEFAKLMSKAGMMIRPAFRDNPGACLGISMQALRWGMDPFAVCNKAYVTKNKAGEEQIAYEAQLISAVINERAPLQKRLRIEYKGEGNSRQCIVSGLLKGEAEPHVYESPKVGNISPKNSPLWQTDPDQQLGYFSVARWARRYAAEVILGVYTDDELAEQATRSGYGPDHVKDITPPSAPPPTRSQFKKQQDQPKALQQGSGLSYTNLNGEVFTDLSPEDFIAGAEADIADLSDPEFVMQLEELNADALEVLVVQGRRDLLQAWDDAKQGVMDQAAEIEGPGGSADGPGAEQLPEVEQQAEAETEAEQYDEEDSRFWQPKINEWLDQHRTLKGLKLITYQTSIADEVTRMSRKCPNAHKFFKAKVEEIKAEA